MSPLTAAATRPDATTPAPAAAVPSRFVIGDEDFLLDGRPHRIISGALHYFRVHPDLWADRIDKARLLGLNTVETYVPWNAHAPAPDRWTTDGMLDLGRFLRTVAEAGLHAIVRPGPYICAEWDNGGLPAWLFRDPSVGVRSSEPRYLSAVTDYLSRVYDIVAPLQVDREGPVLLVQIENEYGAYGEDQAYLRALVDHARAGGITVPLVTVDQPEDDMLRRGSLDTLHRTGSFGSRSLERLATLRRHQPTGPLMCSEFWDGWFDHWGSHHHTTSPEAAARDLDDLLGAGASVNLYMFHGGTSFGFSSGANDHGTYQPLTTSYDYDAPLDEAGWPTAKFEAFREVIARHAPVPDEPLPRRPGAPRREIELRDPVPLLDGAACAKDGWRHETPPTLDDLGPQVRLAFLRTTLPGPASQARSALPAVLRVGEVRDRVAVLLDGSPVGVLSRDHHEDALVLPRSHGELTLVVEDQGRVNYGPRIGEAKGVVGGVTLDDEPLLGWYARRVDLDAVPGLWGDAPPGSIGSGAHLGPVALRGSFTLDDPVDCFLDTRAAGRGVAWVNGFCLGRYWRRGPQHTLYVPGPVLRAGENDVVLLEMEVPASSVRLVDGPDLGHTAT